MNELIFLGSGSSFTLTNYQSNILLKYNGKNLLIDCGTDIRHSISSIGLSHRDIDAVYISHLHADHVGGLEWLALYSHFDADYIGKPKLYANQTLKRKLWSNSLSNGLSTIENKPADLETFFDIQSVGLNDNFEWNGITFHMVQTNHVTNEFDNIPSFGLLFDLNDKRIFLTTDTQFCPNCMFNFYRIADIIFHDCETQYVESGVHAHYDKLKTLPSYVKEKMWLYHYQDDITQDAKKDGFKGFVTQAQSFK